MSKFLFKIFVVAALCFGFTVSDAHAESGWVVSDHVKARIVPIKAEDDKTSQDSVSAVLELRLAKDWHTYWRVSGDSGLPPQLDWSESENIDTVDLSWPAPERFLEYDLQTFGYKGEVSIPLQVNVKDPALATIARLKLDILICNEICIPAHMNITADFSKGSKTLSYNQRMYDFAMRSVPQEGESSSLRIETVTLGPDALVLNVFSKKGFNRSDVFPVVGDIGLTGAPEITVSEDDRRMAMITIAKPYDVKDLAGWMVGKMLEVTFVAERESIVKSFEF